jgi:hypothetical protein
MSGGRDISPLLQFIDTAIAYEKFVGSLLTISLGRKAAHPGGFLRCGGRDGSGGCHTYLKMPILTPTSTWEGIMADRKVLRQVGECAGHELRAPAGHGGVGPHVACSGGAVAQQDVMPGRRKPVHREEDRGGRARRSAAANGRHSSRHSYAPTARAVDLRQGQRFSQCA